MIEIKRLVRPNKRSGHPLEEEATTKVAGMVITNTNAFTVHIDRKKRKARGKK